MAYLAKCNFAIFHRRAIFFLPLDSSRRDEHDPKKKNRKKSKLWGVFASKNLDPLKSKFWKTEISAWKISSRWFQITPEFCNSTNGCLRKADPILTSSAISWQRIKTKRQTLTEAGGVIFWVTDKCKVSLELGRRVLCNAALKNQKFEREIFFKFGPPFLIFSKILRIINDSVKIAVKCTVITTFNLEEKATQRQAKKGFKVYDVIKTSFHQSADGHIQNQVQVVTYPRLGAKGTLKNFKKCKWSHLWSFLSPPPKIAQLQNFDTTYFRPFSTSRIPPNLDGLINNWDISNTKV